MSKVLKARLLTSLGRKITTKSTILPLDKTWYPNTTTRTQTQTTQQPQLLALTNQRQPLTKPTGIWLAPPNARQNIPQEKQSESPQRPRCNPIHKETLFKPFFSLQLHVRSHWPGIISSIEIPTSLAPNNTITQLQTTTTNTQQQEYHDASHQQEPQAHQLLFQVIVCHWCYYHGHIFCLYQ